MSAMSEAYPNYTQQFSYSELWILNSEHLAARHACWSYHRYYRMGRSIHLLQVQGHEDLHDCHLSDGYRPGVTSFVAAPKKCNRRPLIWRLHLGFIWRQLRCSDGTANRQHRW